MEAEALTFQPQRVRAELDEAHAEDPSKPQTGGNHGEHPLKTVHEALGDGTGEGRAGQASRATKPSYTLPVESIGVAAAIVDEYDKVGLERQDIRLYPGGSLGANIVGATGWDGHGLLGLRSSMDSIPWPEPTDRRPTTEDPTVP